MRPRSPERPRPRGIGRLALALLGLFLLAAAPAKAQEREGVLQGLDKVTARVSTFTVQVDKPVRLGTLEITLKACKKNPPEEPPESAAYLEIRELRIGEQARQIFSGWMFASSPALNPLHHPVYDVWVLDCKAVG